MATLVLGPDGEQTCQPCGYSFCASRGYICETDGCECLCRREAERAQAADARSDAALANIARDIENEARPDVRDLTAERFGRPRRSAA